MVSNCRRLPDACRSKSWVQAERLQAWALALQELAGPPCRAHAPPGRRRPSTDKPEPGLQALQKKGHRRREVWQKPRKRGHCL